MKEATFIVWSVGGLVWFVFVVALIPVAVCGTLGVMPTVYAYFVGMAIRLTICLGTYLVAVTSQFLPAHPVATTFVIFYVPLLFVEVGVAGRYLWSKDFLNDHTDHVSMLYQPIRRGGVS